MLRGVLGVLQLEEFAMPCASVVDGDERAGREVWNDTPRFLVEVEEVGRVDEAEVNGAALNIKRVEVRLRFVQVGEAGLPGKSPFCDVAGDGVDVITVEPGVGAHSFEEVKRAMPLRKTELDDSARAKDADHCGEQRLLALEWTERAFLLVEAEVSEVKAAASHVPCAERREHLRSVRLRKNRRRRVPSSFGPLLFLVRRPSSRFSISRW
jgi:hypothetical protein